MYLNKRAIIKTISILLLLFPMRLYAQGEWSGWCGASSDYTYGASASAAIQTCLDHWNTRAQSNYYSKHLTYELGATTSSVDKMSDGSIRAAQWSELWIRNNDTNTTSFSGASISAQKRLYSKLVIDSSDEIPACTAGNPIEVSTGKKYEHVWDLQPANTNGVGVEWFYSNTTLNNSSLRSWQLSYWKSLGFFDVNAAPASSSAYYNGSQACTNGWSDLRENPANRWGLSATTQYKNDKCHIIKEGKKVGQLLIVPDIGTPANYSTEMLGKISKFLPVTIRNADGSKETFIPNSNFLMTSVSGRKGKLIGNYEGEIRWIYQSQDGRTENYNENGRLLSISHVNGTKQTLVYDVSGLLASVYDSRGRQLNFSYANGRLASITYDTNKIIGYTYNSSGLITKVTRPDNTSRTYHYENTQFPKHLTGITDERGVRYATWTYDAQGRAISSEHTGGADKTLLAFNSDGSTTVTNPLGKKTIYRFDDIVGARRVVSVEGQPTASCAGANQNYTYTPEGWLASKTDWKGVQTTYTYNSLGQEVSRTEAFGTAEAKTITTEWHPSLYLKTKVTEPDKETLYSYDANGNLLSQTVNLLTTP